VTGRGHGQAAAPELRRAADQARRPGWGGPTAIGLSWLTRRVWANLGRPPGALEDPLMPHLATLYCVHVLYRAHQPNVTLRIIMAASAELCPRPRAGPVDEQELGRAGGAGALPWGAGTPHSWPM
jgi:hypothetical protein